MINYLLIVFISIVFLSCKDKSELLPNSIGKRGEIVLIATSDFWNSIYHKIVTECLTQHYPALPQDENSLDIIKINSDKLTNNIKLTRNILKITYTSNRENTRILIKRNIWAKPQLYVEIFTFNNDSLYSFFKRNCNTLLDMYINEEINRLKKIYEKYNNKLLEKVLLKYGIKLTFPKGYVLRVDLPNFTWISYETHHTSQGFLIYSYSYKDSKEINFNRLLKIRDSILKINVPGPLPNTYMATEYLFTPIKKSFKYNDFYIYEIRGLWKVVNDFMGGPFVLFVIPINKKLIFIDAYVYAPRYNKRNYVWENEAILRTLAKINLQEI